MNFTRGHRAKGDNMANRNYNTQQKHTWKSIGAILLALIIIAGCIFGGLELWGKGNQKPSNWGKNEVVAETNEPVDPTPLPKNGGMDMPETVEDGEDTERVKSSGIALMSAAIPVYQFAAYGVSPAAETAKTVTATVLPDNDAPNTAVTWTVEWKDAEASWAKGKEVSSYVTISFDDSDFQKSKTCTVSCSQAFGEQIVLKVAAKEDETKFATCNIDYVQQVKSIKAKIGDIDVVLGGNTDVTISIRKTEGGAGGQITVTPQLSETYTVKNTYTTTVNLTHETRQKDDDKWLAYNANRGAYPEGKLLSYTDKEDVLNESIYFDRRLFTQFEFKAHQVDTEHSGQELPAEEYFGDLIQATFLAKNFAKQYDGQGNPYPTLKNKVIWTMTVTLSSEKYNFTYESDIRWAAIDETALLEDVKINDGQDIIFP